MQLPPIHKNSNVHFHVHYHVHKSPQMPQTSRDNSKITYMPSMSKDLMFTDPCIMIQIL